MEMLEVLEILSRVGSIRQSLFEILEKYGREINHQDTYMRLQGAYSSCAALELYIHRSAHEKALAAGQGGK